MDATQQIGGLTLGFVLFSRQFCGFNQTRCLNQLLNQCLKRFSTRVDISWVVRIISAIQEVIPRFDFMSHFVSFKLQSNVPNSSASFVPLRALRLPLNFVRAFVYRRCKEWFNVGCKFSFIEFTRLLARCTLICALFN